MLFRKKMQRELRRTESNLHKVFSLLKEELEDHIRALEHAKTKRSLTREETRIINKLKKNCDDAEKVLRGEIEDVEEEIAHLNFADGFIEFLHNIFTSKSSRKKK